MWRLTIPGSDRGAQRGNSVCLIYARVEREGSEPLVGVVDDEIEAAAVEREVGTLLPGVRVSWEDHEVIGDDDGTVYVVFIETRGAEPLLPPHEEPDPVGLAVFAQREDADAHAVVESRRLGDQCSVRRLTRGWRRAGWPFDGQPLSPL